MRKKNRAASRSRERSVQTEPLKLRKAVLLFLMAGAILAAGCSKQDPKLLQEDDLKNIADLSTLKCTFHQTSISEQKGAESWWFGLFPKDLRFWIEYDCVAEYGINGHEISVEQEGDTITITMPQASLLTSNIVGDSLKPEGYINDTNAVKMTGERETQAFEQAKKEFDEIAENNQDLINQATNRAKMLLENYVLDLGEQIGKNFKVEFKILEPAEAGS